MANNDILRSIRDALHLDDKVLMQIFRESGRDVGQSTISAFLKSEHEDGYIPCSDPIIVFFMEGLIIYKRGRKDNNQTLPAQPAGKLTNNDIIKKLRIALDLKEDALVSVFKAASVVISKNDLSALFRKESNKHYKECSDHILKSFLKGLALYSRN